MSLFQTAIALLLVAYLWKTLSGVFDRPLAVQHGGFVHPDFQEVKEVFEKNVEKGTEPGASFSVYHNGKTLVDLWGGYADPDASRPWQHNTLSQAWSCTKGVVAVVMAMLVDRGLLDYGEHVHKYWPEFKQNGKSNITLSMLLSHQAGVVALNRQISLLEYRDNWTEIESLMAQSKPAWPPGTMYSYHAYTYGMYADAVVRKVDPKHRNISEFFQEEIAEPFGIDFYVGLPHELYYRSARGRYVHMWQIFQRVLLEQPSRWKWISELLPNGVVHGSMNVVDIANNMDVMNDPELQSIGLPSAIGFGTARSLAKLYDYLANGGSIKGKQLLSQSQVKALSTPVTVNLPVILAPDLPYAMGTIVETNIQGGVIFGHRGYGGQTAFADPGYGVGVSYITNFNSRFSETDDPRVQDLMAVLYKCLEKYKKQGS